MAQDLKLPSPELIRQTAATCWAASLVACLSVTPLRPKWSMQVIFETAIVIGAADPKTGGLVAFDISLGFPPLMRVLNEPMLQIRMETKFFQMQNQLSDAIGSIFMQLAHGNYVYLVFPSGPTDFHVVVVFGGGDTGLIVMDQEFGFRTINLSELRAPLLVGFQPEGLIGL
jgi:hypothetical protein